MKKILAMLLAVLMVLCLVACGEAEAPAAETAAPAEAAAEAPAEEAAAPAAPVAEEVRGVTIPAFTVLVNGVEVNQDMMAAYPMYSVQSFSINSSGTESTTTFIGFKMKDVCEAAGLTDAYVWVEASASDGYAVELADGIVLEDTTLLAMTRNGEPFSASPWFAPCSSQTTGDYLKGCASILVNTVAEKPEIVVEAPAAEEAPAELPEGLPEISDKTDKVEFAPYSFKVNGAEVTNDTLAGLSIYKITVTTVNSKGTASESTYTGYKLSDVLAACGVTGAAKVSAVANDGYAAELDAALIESDYTLVAIEKDKETGEDGTIWLAPCSETSSGSYCKLVVELVAE